MGLKLPQSIAKFYLENNGGEPEQDIFMDDGYEYMVNCFWPLILPDTFDDTIIKNRELVEDVLPKWFVPIADDGGDLLYGFSIQDGEKGAIYNWCSDYDYGEDPEDHVVYLSKSIQDFVDAMIHIDD